MATTQNSLYFAFIVNSLQHASLIWSPYYAFYQLDIDGANINFSIFVILTE